MRPKYYAIAHLSNPNNPNFVVKVQGSNIEKIAGKEKISSLEIEFRDGELLTKKDYSPTEISKKEARNYERQFAKFNSLGRMYAGIEFFKSITNPPQEEARGF